jgi:hypothetical protein
MASLKSLGGPDQYTMLQEVIARGIIAVARKGERNPKRLCTAALITASAPRLLSARKPTNINGPYPSLLNLCRATRLRTACFPACFQRPLQWSEQGITRAALGMLEQTVRVRHDVHDMKTLLLQFVQ